MEVRGSLDLCLIPLTFSFLSCNSLTCVLSSQEVSNYWYIPVTLPASSGSSRPCWSSWSGWLARPPWYYADAASKTPKSTKYLCRSVQPILLISSMLVFSNNTYMKTTITNLFRIYDCAVAWKVLKTNEISLWCFCICKLKIKEIYDDIKKTKYNDCIMYFFRLHCCEVVFRGLEKHLNPNYIFVMLRFYSKVNYNMKCYTDT